MTDSTPANSTAADSIAAELQIDQIYSGLSYTESVHTNAGTYSVPGSDCVSHTIAAGAAVGVTLPNDVTPENFGFDLPPSDP
jgi:hypothetical protein